ncbi:hypothetical protein K474DRAFT_1591297 [Panus rudis PR-1116 ss-1]|nr:hypothetical protein K474DRAFT_1591297 [Panus rudis PR-1116 ss-1]
MSDSTPSFKYYFAVWAPDYTDPEALNRRLAVRPQHLEGARALIEKGHIKVGGAMVTPETYQAEDVKMAGSVMIYSADSIEDVKSLIENDPYWVGNVWDKEKLSIMPFRPAKPL